MDSASAAAPPAISVPSLSLTGLPRIPAGVFLAFRRLFAMHTCFQLVLQGRLHRMIEWSTGLREWNALNILVHVGVYAAVVFAAWHVGWRRRYVWSVGFLLLVKVSWILLTFPRTGNHVYWEAFMLFVLTAFPAWEEGKTPEEAGTVDGTAAWLIMLSEYGLLFFSGAQKLFHGFYANGEYFALQYFFPGGHTTVLGEMLRNTAAVVASLLGGGYVPAAVPYPELFTQQALSYPGWVPVLLVSLSWLTVLIEMGLPVLALFPRTRRFAVPGFVVLAAGIALMSAEMDFFFAHISCLLLFFPRIYPRVYVPLIGAHALYAVGAEVLGWHH